MTALLLQNLEAVGWRHVIRHVCREIRVVLVAAMRERILFECAEPFGDYNEFGVLQKSNLRTLRIDEGGFLRDSWQGYAW